jgi:hypothetical protein
MLLLLVEIGLMISETKHDQTSSHDVYIMTACHTFYAGNVSMQNLSLAEKVMGQAVLDLLQRCVKCPFTRTIEFALGHQDRLPSCDVFCKWK